jgi:branched-chain amino acid transport system substrate-binding protein
MKVRMRTRKAAVSVAVGAALAVALTTAASAATTARSADTILVGSIAGTTGAYGSTGVAMVNGAKLAVDDLNAKGGVLGKKFSLQSYNDQASATLSSQLYKRLVSAGAVAVLGSGDTGPATAAMAQRLKIPNIGAVDDAGLTIYPNGPSKPPFEWVWSWGLNTFAWGALDAHYAQKHCKALAVLHDPSTYGGGGDAAIKLAYKGSSKKIVLDAAISEDWSTGATVGLTNEINKIKSAGDGAIGGVLTTQLHPTPALASFYKRYKARFHLDATPFAVANYDALMTLAQVIKKAGSTDPDKLKDGLDSVKNYKGLQGTVSFSEQNHATITEKQLTVVRYNAAKDAWVPVK